MPEPMPPWQAVEKQFRQDFPTLDPAFMRSWYERAQELQKARAEVSERGEESTAKWGLRKFTTPVREAALFATGNWSSGAVYEKAKARVLAGNPEPGDYKDIAVYEREQQLNAQEGLGATIVGGALQVPGIAAEFALGGGVARKAGQGLAMAAPKLAGLVTGATTTTGKLGQAAVRSGATAPFVPTLYADRAVQNNVAAGRDPLDWRGLPAAVGTAVAEMAVMGPIAELAVGKIAGEGVGKAVGRVGAQAAVGPFAQGAAELVSDAGNLDTGHGTVALWAQGKYGELARKVVTDAFTWAAFGANHEFMNAFARGTKAMAKAGLTAQQAAERWQKYLDRDPTMTAALAQAKLDALPENAPATGPIREAGKTVVDALRRGEATGRQHRYEAKGANEPPLPLAGEHADILPDAEVAKVRKERFPGLDADDVRTAASYGLEGSLRLVRHWSDVVEQSTAKVRDLMRRFPRSKKLAQAQEGLAKAQAMVDLHTWVAEKRTSPEAPPVPAQITQPAQPQPAPVAPESPVARPAPEATQTPPAGVPTPPERPGATVPVPEPVQPPPPPVVSETARLQSLLERAKRLRDEAQAELDRAFPHGRPKGKVGQGYDDRLRQVQNHKRRIAELEEKLAPSETPPDLTPAERQRLATAEEMGVRGTTPGGPDAAKAEALRNIREKRAEQEYDDPLTKPQRILWDAVKAGKTLEQAGREAGLVDSKTLRGRAYYLLTRAAKLLGEPLPSTKAAIAERKGEGELRRHEIEDERGAAPPGEISGQFDPETNKPLPKASRSAIDKQLAAANKAYEAVLKEWTKEAERARRTGVKSQRLDDLTEKVRVAGERIRSIESGDRPAARGTEEPPAGRGAALEPTAPAADLPVAPAVVAELKRLVAAKDYYAARKGVKYLRRFYPEDAVRAAVAEAKVPGTRAKAPRGRIGARAQQAEQTDAGDWVPFIEREVQRQRAEAEAGPPTEVEPGVLFGGFPAPVWLQKFANSVSDWLFSSPQRAAEPPVKIDRKHVLPRLQRQAEQTLIANAPRGVSSWGGIGRLFDNRGSNDPVDHAVTTRAYNRHVGDSLAALWAQTQPAERPFLTAGPDGRIELANGRRAHMADVFEAELRRRGSQPLTREQRDWLWNTYRPLQKDFLAMMRAEGVRSFVDDNGNVIPLRPDYFPRPAVGKQGHDAPSGPGSPPGGPQRPGSKSFFQKERKYKTERAGARGKVLYDPDAVSRVTKMIQGGYRAVADHRLANDPSLGAQPAKGHVWLETEFVHGAPAFAGKVYPVEVARKLQAAYGETTPGWLRSAEGASQTMKGAVLSGDVSAPFVQGLPLLLTSPRAWGRAYGQSVKAIADPGALGKYVSANRESASRFVQSGGSVGRLQDYLQGLEKGGTLAKLPLFERMGRAHGTFLDVAKLELWNAWEPLAKPNERAALVEFIENLVGQSRMEAAGLNPSRLAAERALILAPSYYRTAPHLVATMLQRGLPGKLARRSLGKFLGGLALSHVGLMLAVGLDWDEIGERLNPSKGKFLKVPVSIGGVKMEVGAGHIFTSLTRLVGDGVEYFTSDNPIDTGSQGNPVIRWLRGHAGPMPKLAIDLFTGEDFLGNRQPASEAALRAFEPLVIQQFFHGEGDVPQNAAEALAGFFGLQAFPENPNAAYHGLLQQESRKSLGKGYEELTVAEQVRVVRAVEKGEVPPKPEPTASQLERAGAADIERQRRIAKAVSGESREKLSQLGHRLPGYDATLSVDGTKVPLTDEQIQRYEELLAEEYDKVIGRWDVKSLKARGRQARKDFLERSLEHAKEVARARLIRGPKKAAASALLPR